MATSWSYLPRPALRRSKPNHYTSAHAQCRRPLDSIGSGPGRCQCLEWATQHSLYRVAIGELSVDETCRSGIFPNVLHKRFWISASDSCGVDRARRTTSAVEDFPRNGLQWAYAVDRTQFNRLLGHAENDAAGFVLRHSPSARLTHFEQPARAVVAHAGHDDS
jgi:hypothetical protein